MTICLQRIFDNGTCVHLRLQNYLLKSGVLLDDEAPLFNREYESEDIVRIVNTRQAGLYIKNNIPLVE